MKIFSEPWPWYVAGPLIGLIVPVLLLFDNKQFGISSTLRDFCAYVLPKKPEYFNYDVSQHVWRNILVLGVLVGGVILLLIRSHPQNAHISVNTVNDLRKIGLKDFSGLVPSEIFSWSGLLSVKGFTCIMLGGFFVGFGTRYADGCTSGHAIFGLSIFSRASFISVLGFFAGGLFTTYILFPLIFS